MVPLLWILAFVGSSVALSPGLQYEYTYEGRLGMGIPEIRNRFAGTGIRTRVLVQVQPAGKAVVQLKYIKVGEYLQDIRCGLRYPLPIHYSPLSGHGRLLEQPFLIDLTKSQGVMMVNQEEKEWVTNLRKSIATLFLIHPIRTSFGHNERNEVPIIPNDQPLEPSIFGLCRSQYSVVSQSRSLLLNDPSEVTSFVEPTVGGGGISEEENDTEEIIYNIKRSIDFDDCSEKVMLQHSGIGDIFQMKDSKSMDIVLQSSLMDATVVQERSGHYRLQRAQVEGSLVLNPFGIEQEKIISISNQTLQLARFVSKFTPLQLPPHGTKVVKSWYMEIASPYSLPKGGAPIWINYYNTSNPLNGPTLPESIITGIPVNEDDIAMFKNATDQLLSKTSSLMLSVSPVPVPHKVSPFGTNEAKVLANLEVIVRTLRGLDVSTLQLLFDNYLKDESATGQMKLTLFIDACAASGSSAPVRMLLKEIKAGRISLVRTASIFVTLSNNLVSSPVLSDIMSFVKSLNLEKNPYTASTILVNFASTLRRLCFRSDEKQWSYPRYIFGAEECNSKEVLNGILPFLQQQLKVTKESWKQQVLIRALANLGSRETFPTLNNTIHGNYTTGVKASAMYALIPSRMPQEIKNEIFDSLSPVVLNSEADDYLRQAAVVTLSFWRPLASWWQKAAQFTWQDQSSDVASFMYMFLKSKAQQGDPAFAEESKMAQRILQMAKPFESSFQKSTIFSVQKFLPEDYLNVDFELSALGDKSSPFPREVFGSIVNSIRGLHFAPLKAQFSNPSDLKENFEDSSKSGNKNSFDVFSHINNYQKSLFSKDKDEDWSSLFTLFDNLDIFAPPSLSKFVEEEATLSSLGALVKGKDLHLTKFVNAAPVEVFLPTQIGFPLIAKVSTPTVNAGEAKLKLGINEDQHLTDDDLSKTTHTSWNLTTNYKFATKTVTTVRALIPWSEKSVSVGVETLKSWSLPMTCEFGIKNSPIVWNASLHIVPTYYKTFPVFHAQVIPFVSIGPMFPGPDPEVGSKILPVSLVGTEEPSVHKRVLLNKALTGIDGALRWEGDIPFPFTTQNMIDHLSHPEKMFKLLTTPSVRMWSTTIYVNLGSSSSKEFHASLAKSKDPFGVYTNLLLTGSEPRFFEANATFSPVPPSSTQSLTTLLSVNVSRSGIRSYGPQSSYCLNLTTTSPLIENSCKSLKEHLSSGIEVTSSGFLKTGTSCLSGEKTIKFNATSNVSKERRLRLLGELDNACEFDPTDLLTSFRTPFVYDTSELTINYTEHVPDTVRNGSYYLYDLVENWSFPHITVNPALALGGESWELEGKLPSESLKIDAFLVPSALQRVSPSVNHSRRETWEPPWGKWVLDPKNTCAVVENQLLTFFGENYGYKPGPCTVYVVVNNRDESQPKLALSKAEKGHYEGQLIASAAKMNITFDYGNVRVNGQRLPLTDGRWHAVKLPNGTLFANVRKTLASITVDTPSNFLIMMYEKSVFVEPYYEMLNQLGGLCGSYHEYSQGGLIGPKYCHYPTYLFDLYVASWTLDIGKGCNEPNLIKLQERIKAFQKVCKKVEGSNPLINQAIPKMVAAQNSKIHSNLARIITTPATDPHCDDFVYKIMKSGSVICVTRELIKICKPYCYATGVNIHREVYKCWMAAHAPKALIDNLKRGYITYKIKRRAMVHLGKNTVHATWCSRKK